MENPFSKYWLPPDVSAHGPAIDRLINVLHIFMLVLFIGWAIYLVYCLVRFRAREGQDANASHGHFRLPTYLEIGIVFFEVVLLVFVSTPIWASYKTAFPPEAEAVVVQVTAEQFAWNFHYPGKDGKFGIGKIDKIDGTNPLGLDRDDPDSKDDITTINELHIPVNRPIIVHIRSKDVIHDFNIPAMRVKQDAVPGMSIPIWFQATQTGQYDIACAQLCGLSHYRMKGTVFVETPEQYQAWLDEQAKELAGDAAPAAGDATAPGTSHDSKAATEGSSSNEQH